MMIAFGRKSRVMQSPQGSIVALSSASATLLSVGMVALGYWGIMDPPPWTWGDVFVVLFAMVGFVSLGLVPLISTAPVTEERHAKVGAARRLFAVGICALGTAAVVAMFTNEIPRPASAPAPPVPAAKH